MVQLHCLILAGGLGTRVQGVAGGVPKALIPVGPRPFLDWQLRWLKALGVTDVVLALGHGGEQIQEYVEGHSERGAFPRARFSFDGEKLLGTGGAIRKALPFLPDNFAVIYGDSFLFLDIRQMSEEHDARSMPVTLSIFRNLNQGDTSNVFYEAGKPLRYDKKNVSAEMAYIDYGLTLVRKGYFAKNVPEGVSDFAAFLTQASEKGDLAPFVATEMFHEIGSPAGLERFRGMMKACNHDLARVAREHGLLHAFPLGLLGL